MKPPSRKEIARVGDLSEDEVKTALAEILGEPFVPKDWGGERSDLYTNRIHVDGEAKSAAFAFKGPAQRGELHPAGMGVRGDQGIRLFSEPVDLVVVQHHTKIASTVAHFMQAFCAMYKRQFMIVDGADTARVLKAYNYL